MTDDMRDDVRVWSWRHAVQRSDLPSTTKLVLFNLSVYMNECGDGCYPSIKKQAKDTGLSERAVCEHLKKAVEAGFLRKSVHGYGGQKWSRNEYIAMMPNIDNPAKGTDAGSVRQGQGTDPRSVRQREGTDAGSAEGTDPDDKKALTQGQSNSPVNTPINTPDCSLVESDKQKRRDDQLWFHGDTIRLTKPDYERWRGMVGWSDDFFWDWLVDRERWYAEQLPAIRRKWFIATERHLTKKAREQGEKRA